MFASVASVAKSVVWGGGEVGRWIVCIIYIFSLGLVDRLNGGSEGRRWMGVEMCGMGSQLEEGDDVEMQVGEGWEGENNQVVLKGSSTTGYHLNAFTNTTTLATSHYQLFLASLSNEQMYYNKRMQDTKWQKK